MFSYSKLTSLFLASPTPSVSTASTVSTSSAVPTSSSTSRSASRSSKTTSETPTYVYTASSSSISYQATVYSTQNVVITTQPDGQTSQSTQYTVVQTTIPATTVFGTTVVTSTESPTGIAGLQANGGTSGSSGSLTTGAKAGIGAGVAVAVIAAAVIGALYAIRRRRQRNAAIADSDRYTPSLGNSMNNFGYAGAAVGKNSSRYTDSEINTHSPPMRESNPLDRYATPGVSSQRTSAPTHSQSRTSDISSVSGSEPTPYRPGPGMPAVTEQRSRSRSNFVEELPEHNNDYLHPRSQWPAGVGAAAAGAAHHDHGGDAPSLYSDDGDHPARDPSPAHPAHPANRQGQASPAALELSGENTMNRSGSGGSAGQSYRAMDPEYQTRTQLTKPEGKRFDPSHNF
ncbi:hypothetical protein LTR70_005880 [Exophiala xenobiotica]|uniref:Uncharacterized protein n=1 Tax=Lithohypha guttulata TaxID=1690604 RepID=A0ABR0JUZ1_9EURO|nr:hypothetical protein LTR24_010213 [Lithohypha guttulata]KAK5317263.1 hypothetical protein LTR70_005880 [Exophiala xenobiotica]